MAAVDDRPLLMVWIGVLLFSIGPVLIAASSTSGAVLSFWRLWLGAALLGALTLWRRWAGGLRTSRRGWGWTAAAGLAFGVHQLFFMIAIKATSVVDVTLMQVLQPIFVGLLAVVMFGERPGLAFRLWSLVAVGGAAVVVLAGTVGPEGDPVGMALAVANVVFFALYFVWSKQAMSSISALPFLFGALVVAGLVVGLFALVAGEPVAAISTRDLLIAALIAVVPGALGHFASIHPLRRVPANIPPVIQLSMPFLSGALAWLLLGQGITWMHVLGGAVTIAGVTGALLSRGARRLGSGAAATAEAAGTTPSPVPARPGARAATCEGK